MNLRPGIGVYSSCKSKLIRRYVKPDLRAGESDNLPPMGAYCPPPACLHLQDSFFRKQKNIRIPGAGKTGTKGKRNQFWVMEDALTLVLVIVLYLLLKPLVAAILRGLGSSEHRRDR